MGTWESLSSSLGVQGGKKIKTKPICHYEGKRVSSFSIRKMVENTGLDLWLQNGRIIKIAL